jgi:hypothetical protein
MGATIAMAGASAVWLALLTSGISLAVLAFGGAVIAGDVACLVWLLILADRYNLFWKRQP